MSAAANVHYVPSATAFAGLGDKNNDIMTVCFSERDDMVVVGGNDGHAHVMRHSGEHLFNLSSTMCAGQALKSVITAIRFRPAGSAGTQNVVAISGSNGEVSHWHTTSQKFLGVIQEEGNEIYTLDYNTTGNRFATAGKDCMVRIYDEDRKSVVQTLQSPADVEEKNIFAHTSRIQSMKWVHASVNPNLIVTGGWDYTVQVWDTRTSASVRNFYGPYICGEGIDVHGTGASDAMIVTGSCRGKEQVELWDLGTGKKVKDLPVPPGTNDSDDGLKVFATKFSPNGLHVAIGGQTGFAVVDVQTASSAMGVPRPTGHAIFASAFSSDGRKLLAAGARNTLLTYDKSGAH